MSGLGTVEGSGSDESLIEKVMEIMTRTSLKPPAAMAAELGMSEMTLLRHLPEEMVTEVSHDRFDEIVAEVSQWGSLTVIVQNESTILEAKGQFPVGSYAHGYYNLESKETPVGGHIKASDLSAIFFVSRPFMGMETHSIQFFDHGGQAMFKLYLGRNEERKLMPDQKEKFLALKERLASAG